jgi:hypothetical protein
MENLNRKKKPKTEVKKVLGDKKDVIENPKKPQTQITSIYEVNFNSHQNEWKNKLNNFIKKFIIFNKFDVKRNILPYHMIIRNFKYNLVTKFNTKISDFREIILEYLMLNRSCHLVSVFKDYMIYDYVEEFLKRYYTYKEVTDRLPKIANYYKNYLQFFCKPTFTNFLLNDVIQCYGDYKAELYYKRNYGNKNKETQDKKDENIIFNTTLKEKINQHTLSTIRQNILDEEICLNEVDFQKNMLKRVINSKGRADSSKNSINLFFNHSKSNLMKSGLFTARSKENSIENILSTIENKEVKIYKDNNINSRNKNNAQISQVSYKNKRNLNLNPANYFLTHNTIQQRSPDSQVINNYNFNYNIIHTGSNNNFSTPKINLNEILNTHTNLNNEILNSLKEEKGSKSNTKSPIPLITTPANKHKSNFSSEVKIPLKKLSNDLSSAGNVFMQTMKTNSTFSPMGRQTQNTGILSNSQNKSKVKINPNIKPASNNNGPNNGSNMTNILNSSSKKHINILNPTQHTPKISNHFNTEGNEEHNKIKFNLNFDKLSRNTIGANNIVISSGFMSSTTQSLAGTGRNKPLINTKNNFIFKSGSNIQSKKITMETGQNNNIQTPSIISQLTKNVNSRNLKSNMSLSKGKTSLVKTVSNLKLNNFIQHPSNEDHNFLQTQNLESIAISASIENLNLHQQKLTKIQNMKTQIKRDNNERFGVKKFSGMDNITNKLNMLKPVFKTNTTSQITASSNNKALTQQVLLKQTIKKFA